MIRPVLSPRAFAALARAEGPVRASAAVGACRTDSACRVLGSSAPIIAWCQGPGRAACGEGSTGDVAERGPR